MVERFEQKFGHAIIVRDEQQPNLWCVVTGRTRRIVVPHGVYDRIRKILPVTSDGLALAFVRTAAQTGDESMDSGGKWGIINEKCEVVVAAEYDSMHTLRQGALDLVVVQKEDKWGVITLQGLPVLPIRYDWVREEHANEGVVLVAIGHKWGIVTLRGEELVQPAYDWIGWHFFDGVYCKVRMGNKYGVLNSRGQEVVPPEYDDISWKQAAPAPYGGYVCTGFVDERPVKTFHIKG